MQVFHIFCSFLFLHWWKDKALFPIQRLSIYHDLFTSVTDSCSDDSSLKSHKQYKSLKEICIWVMNWHNKATSRIQGQDGSCSLDLRVVQIIDRTELSIHQQNCVTSLQRTELGLTSSPHFINVSSSQLTSATRRLETEKKDTIKILAHSEWLNGSSPDFDQTSPKMLSSTPVHLLITRIYEFFIIFSYGRKYLMMIRKVRKGKKGKKFHNNKYAKKLFTNFSPIFLFIKGHWIGPLHSTFLTANSVNLKQYYKNLNFFFWYTAALVFCERRRMNSEITVARVSSLASYSCSFFWRECNFFEGSAKL